MQSGLKEVEYDPISDKRPEVGKGKEAGYQIGGIPSQTVDLLGEYSTQEKNAINYYKGLGGGVINDLLSRYKDKPLGNVGYGVNTVKSLDSAMAKGVINKDQILFRGVQDLGNTLQLGSVIKPYNFQSTTTLQQFAHSWQDNKLVLRIKVPKGTHAIAIEKVNGQPSGSDDEHEVILPRNVAYKVTDIYHSDDKLYANVDLIPGIYETTK